MVGRCAGSGCSNRSISFFADGDIRDTGMWYSFFLIFVYVSFRHDVSNGGLPTSSVYLTQSNRAVYQPRTGCPHLFNIDFPWLFHDQKIKIHDLLAQHIFLSKWYATYECIPELVVTVPSACSTIVKKIKRFIIWPYKWSCATFTELLSAVVKIPWHYHHFPWLSMTFAIFHDFPGLENGLPKFHDFPWPGGTLIKAVTNIHFGAQQCDNILFVIDGQTVYWKWIPMFQPQSSSHYRLMIQWLLVLLLATSNVCSWCNNNLVYDIN